MLRLTGLVRRAEGVAEPDFARFRRDTLGPLVAGMQTRLGICRYVQTHRGAGSASAEAGFMAARPGTGNRFDGIEEYWWVDDAACVAAVADAHGEFAALAEACRGWIDMPASAFWLGIEYPQVACGAGRVVAAPRSGLARLVFAIAPPDGTGFAAAQSYWLRQHGPLVRRFAVARGTLAYTQVHRVLDGPAALARAGWIDFSDEFIGHAEAWFAEVRPAPGADGAAAMAAAIADETRFIDWRRGSVLVGKELMFVERSWD